MTKILLDCAQASPVNRGHTAASGLLSKLVVSPVGPALYYYVLYYTQTTLLVIIADDEIRLLLPLAQYLVPILVNMRITYLRSCNIQIYCLQIDNNLSAGKVQRACSSMDTFTSFVSTIKFETAIVSMYLSNAEVDGVFFLSAARHFDDETFQEGRDIITEGTSKLVNNSLIMKIIMLYYV